MLINTVTFYVIVLFPSIAHGGVPFSRKPLPLEMGASSVPLSFLAGYSKPIQLVQYNEYLAFKCMGCVLLRSFPLSRCKGRLGSRGASVEHALVESVVERRQLVKDVRVPPPPSLHLPDIAHLHIFLVLLLFVFVEGKLVVHLVLLADLLLPSRGAADPHGDHPEELDHRLLGGHQLARQCTHSQVQGSVMVSEEDALSFIILHQIRKYFTI